MPSHAGCGASISQSTSGRQNLNLNLDLLPIPPGVAELLGWLLTTSELIIPRDDSRRALDDFQTLL